MNIVFTDHVEERLKRRKITKQEIIDAIRYPDKTIKKYGKYYYQKKLQRGTIEVSCGKTEQEINIITVYWL